MHASRVIVTIATSVICLLPSSANGRANSGHRTIDNRDRDTSRVSIETRLCVSIIYDRTRFAKQACDSAQSHNYTAMDDDSYTVP